MADEGGTPDEPGRRLSCRAALTFADKHKRKLAVACGLAVFALIWWLVPLVLYRSVPDPKDRAGAEATTRAALLAGFVGLGALGTFWLNSRTLRITARTFEVTEQGHLTDRYTKAIGQLGDEKLDVRLGGIYALERLAVDSDRDHPTVVEVLSAFIRERRSGVAGRSRARPARRRRTAQPPSLTIKGGEQLTTDVQAALSVLGRLPGREGIHRADLAETDLSGADLNKADLTGARLAGATLAKANLTEANLTDADLTEANLPDADLTLATLINTELHSANLTNANFSSANLTNANFSSANLTGAVFLWADLTDAVLGKANLTDTLLLLANLTNALVGGADLTNAEALGENQIASARGDATTRLPEHIARPVTWASPK